MSVGKTLLMRNLVGYKHNQRPGSTEQNTAIGKALQKSSWDREENEGLRSSTDQAHCETPTQLLGR